MKRYHMLAFTAGNNHHLLSHFFIISLFYCLYATIQVNTWDHNPIDGKLSRFVEFFFFLSKCIVTQLSGIRPLKLNYQELWSQ